jgi:hypothetical protein
MTRFSTIFLAAILLTSAAFAQITIHSTDFSQAGYSYTFGMAASTEIAVGSSGANQTWIFGDFYWTVLDLRTYVDAASTPYSSQFPGCTRAEHIAPVFGGHTDSYSYYRIVQDSLIQLGQVADTVVMPYHPPMLQASLPLGYDQHWTSVMSYDYMGTQAVTDSMICHTDGWGTVTTPYGSWQALRVFQHHFQTMRIGSNVLTYEILQYYWINQAGNSVLVLTSGMNEVNPNFTTGSVSMLGVPMSAEPVRGPVAQSFSVGPNYPNPFNPTTEIPVTIAKGGPVTLDVYDELGQLVAHQSDYMPAGTHSFTVDGSSWATGLYFARVTAGTEQRVLKMNLLK